jgi:hypothetical protein
MLGRGKTRNPVSPEGNAPIEWDMKTGRNIKWKALLEASPCRANRGRWPDLDRDK